MNNSGSDVLKEIATSQPDLLVAAIEACPVNITIADIAAPDMPLIYVNPSFAATTGYRICDVIGRNCRFLQGAETDAAEVDVLRDAIRNEDRVTVEFVNYRKDGTPFINNLTVAPVYSATGALVSFIGIQSDVTEERHRAKAEVERQRLEALGQMAGGISHQLNNLLQPVVSLAKLHRDTSDDEVSRQDLDIILESTRQAAHLVGDTLAFARGTSQSIETLNLIYKLEKDIRFISVMLPPSVEVQLSVDPELVDTNISVDPTHFCQMLTNLLLNAAQAMGGNGSILIKAKPLNENAFVLLVIDDGPGIPEHLRNRVLEPFFSTKISNGGTGLGLSVVYGIVNQFGGKIDIAEGHLGRGCCVSVTVPKA